MLLWHLAQIVITVKILILIGLGLVDYLKNFDENDCSMTYMRQPANLIPVHLPPKISDTYPFYKLYLYCEGYDCQKHENLRFTEHGQIPVLFITGNADSHMQVRSLASIGLDKSRDLKKGRPKFQYFTISFNEELSAIYGPILNQQTEFSKHCINHILNLFNGVSPEHKRPKSVLVIGNSMGGIVAKGLLVPSSTEFDTSQVHTIITQASPHIRPVVNIDQPLSSFYERINSFWLNKSESSLNNVVLVSLYGGHRDFLVRSGLANINDWKGRTQASVISAYTPSMPFVWRSIDHKCMAWCRELILSMNRALFDLVDQETEQIIDEKSLRENVFKIHFGIKSPEDLKIKESVNIDINGKLEKINDLADIFVKFNDFNSEKKSFLFTLEMIIGKYDSLFLYTNLNDKNSFLVCKDVKFNAESDFECLDRKDLMVDKGRVIPPYFEKSRKLSTLRTINLNDLSQSLSGYKYFLINLPIWEKKKLRHQLILKLDWYRKEARFSDLNSGLGRIDLEEGKDVYFRYYLSSIRKVWQTYDLRKITPENSCDKYLQNQNQNKNPALSASCLMIQFYEPISDTQSMNEQILHSGAIQTKSKNLSIKLSVNHDLAPFIDVIKFDPKHLIYKSNSNLEKLKCDGNYSIEIEFNYFSFLGQLIRFYFVLIPAFLASILQFYDFIISINSNNSSMFKKSFIFLNKLHLCLWHHLAFSSIVTLIIYMSNSVQIQTDFSLLDQERIYFLLVPFMLYWSAYSLLVISSIFVSVIFKLISSIINKINIFQSSVFAQVLMEIFHVIFSIVICVFSSTLAHCSIFYAEVIRSASNSKSLDGLKFLRAQTRLFLLYLILVLNIPSLIVWTRTIGNGEIKPLFSIIGDCGFTTAAMSILILLMYRFKFRFAVLSLKGLSLDKNTLSVLVLVNSIVTVLYATVSLYRLQYFILIHLFLMCLNSNDLLLIESETQERKNK